MGIDNFFQGALTFATFAALAYGIYRDIQRNIDKQEKDDADDDKEIATLKLENLKLELLLDAEKRDNERLRAERNSWKQQAISVGGDMNVSTIGNEAQVGTVAAGKEIGQEYKQ